MPKIFSRSESQKEYEDFRSDSMTVCESLKLNFLYQDLTKGQLISKANPQVVNSTKKRTNEFIFTTMQRIFIRFMEEIEVNKKTFQN